MGMYRAGFDVVGVDIKPQKHYPFEFHQADALTFPLEGFDFIWASPPCQKYTVCSKMHRNAGKVYPDLIAVTRERVRSAGVPYVIENVPGAPLLSPIRLCGTMFGLCSDDGELRRHRYFESNMLLTAPACRHGQKPFVITVVGNGSGYSNRVKVRNGIRRTFYHIKQRREAMGIDWMNRRELSQAIPPAYSEFIARQILGNYCQETLCA